MYVVDDIRTLTTLLEFPKATIVSVSAPAFADAGTGFELSVSVTNDGPVAGAVFIKVIDIDTGSLIVPRESVSLDPSKTWGMTWSTIMMPNKTWNLEIQAGHVEDGVDVVDSTKRITVRLPVEILPIISIVGSTVVFLICLFTIK